MKSLHSACFVLALFLFLTSFSGSVFAVESTYVIGVENIDYLPHYTGENEQYKGFSRELLDTFAQKRGYRFSYRPLPLNRLFKELFEGKVDFKYPDNPNWSAEAKKDKNIHYSIPVVKVITGLMVLPERETFGLEKFKTIGTMMGFTPTAYKELIKEGRIKRIEAAETDFATLLKVGMLKRVDGVYIAIDVGAYHLREVLKKPDALTFNKNLPHDIQSFSLSSIKYPEIIDEFNEFLLKEKELVKQLKEKYHIIEEK